MKLTTIVIGVLWAGQVQADPALPAYLQPRDVSVGVGQLGAHGDDRGFARAGGGFSRGVSAMPSGDAGFAPRGPLSVEQPQDASGRDKPAR